MFSEDILNPFWWYRLCILQRHHHQWRLSWVEWAHLQIAHWNTAITGVPPTIDPKTCGYESLKTASGSILVPSPVPPGTKNAPDEIREMIYCGCETSECLGNCKCKSIGCTVFCKCGAGVNCKNPLTKKTNTENDDDNDEGESAETENITNKTNFQFHQFLLIVLLCWRFSLLVSFKIKPIYWDVLSTTCIVYVNIYFDSNLYF